MGVSSGIEPEVETELPKRDQLPNDNYKQIQLSNIFKEN